MQSTKNNHHKVLSFLISSSSSGVTDAADGKQRN